MKRRHTVCCLILVLACTMLAAAGSACRENGAGMVSGTATIRYIGIEGGFYGLAADDGTAYDPLELPPAFQQDGLRVRFTGRIRDDVATVRMWGTPLQVLSIELVP